MISQLVTVNNPTGLHARPAKQFVSTAKQFSSKISVLHAGEEYNAKSIVILMSACIGKGSVIKITADGLDEKAAVETLVRAVESGLGE